MSPTCKYQKIPAVSKCFSGSSLSRGFTRRLTRQLCSRVQIPSIVCSPMTVLCKWRLLARRVLRQGASPQHGYGGYTKDLYPGVRTVVKCDLQSADVEMDSGACLYDDGKNKSLSIILNEFTDWLAVLSSITVLLLAISCWLCRLGRLFFCLSVSLSVGLSVSRLVGWFVT
jgi:hypothetical protein